jgi:hypothetical protein
MRILKIGKSLIFGVEHYNMDDVNGVLDYVKKNFRPEDKIIFMGEGGDDNNVYEVGGEQEAIKNGLETYFNNFINDSWDGKETNVLNPNSFLFKEIESRSGLSHNKTMAAVYVIIVGQTNNPQEMSGLLTSEGVEWIKTFGIENPKEPGEEDINIMYDLCFPQDSGKPDTEMTKITNIFNEVRDQNLLMKIKSHHSKGYKVIATAGEGHIDLIKNMEKELSQNKTMNETESLKGGLADGKSLTDIAKKHKVDVDLLKVQLRNGVDVESKEHTKDKGKAKEIAMDHLWEDPKYYIKLKKADVDEMTGADSSGAFSGVPAFGNAPTKVRKINNMEGKKIEATEATDASSSGAFESVPFGAKNTKGGRRNPLQIDGPDSIYKNRAVTDPKWPKFGGPGGYYVKPNQKCEKFPYCNQGDKDALQFIHENYSDLKVAITEVSNKLGVSYDSIQKIVLNEIKQIFI